MCQIDSLELCKALSIQEMLQAEYLLGPRRTYCITDYAGKTYSAVDHTHGLDDWQQRYDRIATFLRLPDLREHTVCGAMSFLIEASAFWESV